MRDMTQNVAPPPRHSLATRLFHGALALAILTQLATSYVMDGPDEESAGDLMFQIHRYAGLTATLLAVVLWLIILSRRRGTKLGALVPWFSGRRLAALWADTAAHFRALIRFRLPPFDADGALSAAVHGLGLLLISAMAVSGAVYFIEVWAGLHAAEPDGMLAMDIHFLLANLVWVYLIAHVGIAAIHHLMRSMRLSEMWSLRG